MRKTLATIEALALAGCGSPDFCAMGGLAGTWQETYVEQAGGTCGPMPTRTSTGYLARPPGCVGTLTFAFDRCSTVFDFTCPVSTTSGVLGSERLVGELHQMSATRIEGSETLSVATNVVNCTSAYSVVAIKQ